MNNEATLVRSLAGQSFGNLLAGFLEKLLHMHRSIAHNFLAMKVSICWNCLPDWKLKDISAIPTTFSIHPCLNLILVISIMYLLSGNCEWHFCTSATVSLPGKQIHEAPPGKTSHQWDFPIHFIINNMRAIITYWSSVHYCRRSVCMHHTTQDVHCSWLADLWVTGDTSSATITSSGQFHKAIHRKQNMQVQHFT